MDAKTDVKFKEFEEEYVFNQDENLQERNEGYYFVDTMNSVSEEVINNNFMLDNNRLFVGITNELYSLNSVSDQIPPKLAGRILEIIFSKIKENGIK